MKILETNDYNRFDFLNENRSVIPNKVRNNIKCFEVLVETKTFFQILNT